VFKVMCKFSCMLRREDLDDTERLKDLNVGDIMCYKYERLVSCEVERIFYQHNIVT
jgi:hypothetical protein